MPIYETLDHYTIIDNVRKLNNRIAERFPVRGLTQAAGDLASLSHVIARDARSLREKNSALRAISLLLLLAGASSIVYILMRIVSVSAEREVTIFEFLQGLEAGFNIIVLTTLGLLFALNRDSRAKRQKALDGLHALRSMAHVVDIHQLNKDPAALVSNLPRTASSPTRDLTPQELLRYLDYCSEMLSMIGKLAALYAQYSRDPVVIETVNDVEQLAASLSNKIWQKIMIINSSNLANIPQPAQSSA
jgi:hypothetical protein